VGPADCAGLTDRVGRPPAGPVAALPARSRRHSKSGRARNSSRSAPGPGNTHTGTAGPSLPPDRPRQGMDRIRREWNTAPPCVLGTVEGAQSQPAPVTARQSTPQAEASPGKQLRHLSEDPGSRSHSFSDRAHTAYSRAVQSRSRRLA
jgi:hypothetical protein